ncbi:MAG: hypothetical protein K2I20_01905 [Clostridia bacterium]|nr:hypothetical protein [Clostridia bacterium]
MNRQEVKEKYKWKIEDIYSSDKEWEKDFALAEKSLDFSEFAGKLSNAETLLKFLRKDEEFSKLADRLGVYAHMRKDEDAANAKYAAYYAKIAALYSKYATEAAFVEPELAACDESYLKNIIADKRFSDFDYALKRILAGKPHVLSEAEERLIGMAGEIFENFYDIFGYIDNLDLPFPEIEWEGEKVKLTHGLYGIIIHSDNREKRREAYEKYYAAYEGLINTITSVYGGNV